MLDPVGDVAARVADLIPGGVFIGYVATTPQLSELVEALREDVLHRAPRLGDLVRDWHVEGLAVRPIIG